MFCILVWSNVLQQRKGLVTWFVCCIFKNTFELQHGDGQFKVVVVITKIVMEFYLTLSQSK